MSKLIAIPEPECEEVTSSAIVIDVNLVFRCGVLYTEVTLDCDQIVRVVQKETNNLEDSKEIFVVFGRSRLLDLVGDPVRIAIENGKITRSKYGTDLRYELFEDKTDEKVFITHFKYNEHLVAVVS